MDQILGATTMYSLPPTAPVRTVPEHLFIPSFSLPRARHDHLPPDMPIAADRFSTFTIATSGQDISTGSVMGGPLAAPMP